jgi:hypothetical protein
MEDPEDLLYLDEMRTPKYQPYLDWKMMETPRVNSTWVRTLGDPKYLSKERGESPKDLSQLDFKNFVIGG